MESSSLIVFAVAYFVMVATPGPGIAALIARVLGGGTRGAPALIAGYVVGDLAWFAAAALGLAAVAKTFATAFLVIKYVGVAYLLYLGYKMWTASEQATAPDQADDASASQLFLAGLTVTLGNPKPMAFFLALLPNVIDLDALTLLAFTELAGIIIAVMALNQSAYVLLASRARRFVSNPRAVKIVNRICGGALVGAAATVAVR